MAQTFFKLRERGAKSSLRLPLKINIVIFKGNLFFLIGATK
jgi:hypothetical protein